MNIFYKNRYDKFINNLRNLGDRNLQGYTERHHIIPNCIKGSNNDDNLIRLTLREHFLAHWLLWKAYPSYLPIVSAFLQMNCKNTKTNKPFQGRITSRIYANLKENAYKLLSEFQQNKVYVKNKDGETLTLSCEDYKNSSYKFHTTGKVHVYDTFTNEWTYINSSEYQQSKDRYLSRMVHSLCKYHFLDQETNEIIKITKSDAKKRNLECKYKRFKQIQNTKIKCYDLSGNVCVVTVEEFNSNSANYTHILKDTISVFDIITKQSIKITKADYNLNPNRYLTSTKGKVLIKDDTGNTVLISKEKFKTGNYVGITKGLRTVLNKKTNKYVQITEEEFKNNKSLYAGPNIGKLNVINKHTGERSQILKEQYDPKIYSSLGNRKLLFLCQNKLTNKEKLINIYEWDLVKDQYEIINLTQFHQANNLKEK